MHRMNSRAKPVIRLRTDQFRRRCRALGLTTVTAQADHLGLSKWTISRLISGGIGPGETVIASMLIAFPALRFEDLFEVVEETANGSAA